MTNTTLSQNRSRRSIVLEFLGSMNLAITVLVAIALASVIGTVLQQNQPYTDYIIKFGPFWHEVFSTLGLYSVYSTAWFLALLGFLMVSTSVCIYRNGPGMLRDMRRYRLNIQAKSLNVMRNRREWQAGQSPAQVEQTLTQTWGLRGYRVRRETRGDQVVLAGMKGSLNRLGYLLSHVGVVVICVGALVDGNMGLKLKELSGAVELETRDIAASQVPPESRLGPGESAAFRGSVTVPEGATANLVFLNIRDGYLVQELPFAIELKEFRIEHWPNGQPKSFESDLIIHDPELDSPFEQTIAVNHPLIYKGHAIYQASFGDGGSKLQLQAWPLFSGNPQPTEIDARVNDSARLDVKGETMSVEVQEFKVFNIFPAPEDSGKRFVNFGPSFTYTLRDAGGEGRQYVNYMAPVAQEGRYFFLSGVRESLSADFQYLHIPADPNGTMDRFLRFHALLSDPEAVRRIATAEAGSALAGASIENPELRDEVVESMVRLVGMYARGGFAAIGEHLESSVPAERQPQVAEAYMRILENVLQAAYVNLMMEEGTDPAAISEEDTLFYDDAITAMGALGNYGSPLFLRLTDFEHVEASGLQIARAPGKNTVYLGCIMLIIGIFFMFYISHRRLWAILEPTAAGTQVLFAGAGNRHSEEFTREFDLLGNALEKRLAARTDYPN